MMNKAKILKYIRDKKSEKLKTKLDGVKILDFPETYLEQEEFLFLLRSVEKPTIVEEINFNGKYGKIGKIKNIDILNRFTGVKKLNLRCNQIEKIPPECLKVKSLTELHLYKNKIKKINALEQLINLTRLDISDNQIKRIEGLEQLKNLTLLHLSNNQIQKVEGLEKLKNLTQLDISWNQIKRIEGLDHLKKLAKVYLSRNQIEKIEGLEQLKNLKELHLSENRIKKIEGLEQLKHLTLLHLSINQIKIIEGLEELKNLTQLYLFTNQIKKIEGLEELEHLTLLHLSINQINKIEGLEELKNLTELYLFTNQIKKIEGLEEQKKMKNLDLTNNPIKRFHQRLPFKITSCIKFDEALKEKYEEFCKKEAERTKNFEYLYLLEKVKNLEKEKLEIEELKFNLRSCNNEKRELHLKFENLKIETTKVEQKYETEKQRVIKLKKKNQILRSDDKRRKKKEKRIFKDRTILESIEDCPIPLKELSPKRLLGKGQFGVVVEVLHKETKKKFCLKCMYNFHQFQTDGINRKLLDVERVKHIPLHKNIVPIYLTFKAVFTNEFENFLRNENCFSNYSSNKTGFIATPIYQQDFARFCEKRKLEREVPPFFDSKEIIDFLEQLLEGICFLNECEISHRDLKGENVFVDGSNLVIGDFGSHLNFVKDEIENLTLTGQVDGFCKGGSPFYLPNEIIKAKLGKKSILNYSKCDLFAVGLIIYLSLSKFRYDKIKKKFDHFAPFTGWDSMKYYERKQKNYVDLSEKYDVRIRELIKNMLKIKFEERITCFKARKELKKIKKLLLE